MGLSRFRLAHILAFLIPAGLLAGAVGSEHYGHLVIGRDLYPCEMCHWQRWPHYAAAGIALLAFLPGLNRWRFPVTLAALLILVSGGIGVLHAGVEYGWWTGPTQCSSMGTGGSQADVLAQIMSTPLVRCDAPQWTLGPLSLAGMNAIVSILGGLLILALIASAPQRRQEVSEW